jgi:hypothetical protein
VNHYTTRRQTTETCTGRHILFSSLTRIKRDDINNVVPMIVTVTVGAATVMMLAISPVERTQYIQYLVWLEVLNMTLAGRTSRTLPTRQHDYPQPKDAAPSFSPTNAIHRTALATI